MASPVTAESLNRLRESQIERLRQLGFAERILTELDVRFIKDKVIDNVLQRYGHLNFGQTRVPFLPVVSRLFRSPFDQMAVMKYGENPGYTDIEPQYIFDLCRMPIEPYYIMDIEDGTAMLGKRASEAELLFDQESPRRHPLTVEEIMALCMHTDVLSRHFVFAAGSRYGSGLMVPDIRIWDRRRYKLNQLHVDYADDRYGAPSCAKRPLR